MKKIMIPLLFCLAGGSVMAQTEFDALKVQQNDLYGTARYMSMAGAFGALGGDGSSLVLNPAGLGVYRKSELSCSFGVNGANADATWNGVSSNDNRWRAEFTNFTAVLSLETGHQHGLVQSNFAVTYNKLKNFSRNVTIDGSSQSSSLTDYMAGYTNGHISGNSKLVKQLFSNSSNYNPYADDNYGWLSVLGAGSYLLNPNSDSSAVVSALAENENVTPHYMMSEQGYLDQWDFAWGLNFSHKFYLGFSLGLQDMYYKSTTYYAEDFANGGGFSLRNEFETEGTGLNFNMGAIIRPIDALRIGLAFHTPTFYSSSSDNYDGSSYDGVEYTTHSSIGSSLASNYTATTDGTHYYYEIQGPWRYNFSAAYVFGKMGLVSVDYELSDYSSMKLEDDGGSSYAYSTTNSKISNNLKASHSFRIGGEYNLTNEIALRAGYAFVTSPVKSSAIKQLSYTTTNTDPSYSIDKNANYFTLGAGYHSGPWFMDIAYTLKYYKQDFYAYDASNLKAAEVTNKINNIVLTLGMRF